MATVRSSSSSMARQTTPIAPTPIRSSRRSRFQISTEPPSDALIDLPGPFSVTLSTKRYPAPDDAELSMSTTAAARGCVSM